MTRQDPPTGTRIEAYVYTPGTSFHAWKPGTVLDRTTHPHYARGDSLVNWVIWVELDGGNEGSLASRLGDLVRQPVRIALHHSKVRLAL